MDPVTIALLAISSLAFFGGRSNRHVSRIGGPSKPVSQSERIAMLHEIRSMAIHYTNEFDSMPLLVDYLTVVGFRESNFNPLAIDKEWRENPENAARGLFGFRPQYIFKESNGLEGMKANPNALLNPRWSFVCAVFHIWDGCNRLFEKGYTPNFAAIRRWWMLPHLIYDYDIEDDRSRDNLERLKKAIVDCNHYYKTSISPDFIWKPILNWQNYPGMEAMLKVYGLK